MRESILASLATVVIGKVEKALVEGGCLVKGRRCRSTQPRFFQLEAEAEGSIGFSRGRGYGYAEGGCWWRGVGGAMRWGECVEGADEEDNNKDGEGRHGDFSMWFEVLCVV